MAPSLHQTKKRSHLGPASNVAKNATRPAHAKAKALSKSRSELWHKGTFEGQLPKFASRDLDIPSWSKQEYSNPALSSLLELATEDWRCPGPQNPTLITSTEPRVALTVAGKPISFLIDTEATYSAVPACSGKTKVSQVSVMGLMV